jgi:hypothetical protein
MMNMDDKLIGVLYAVVGASIALLGKWAIDAITRRSEKSSHAAYLCVRVVCELDRFATGCAAVAQDFGPEPDDESSEIATVRDPSFAPHELPVDWKSIDIRLVYDVLSLPGEQALADSRISEHSNHEWNDAESTLEMRRELYLKLGLKAARLSRSLRQIGKLPPADDSLDRLEGLDREAKERATRVAKRLAELPPDELDANLERPLSGG